MDVRCQLSVVRCKLVANPDAGSVFDPEAQTRREVRRRAGFFSGFYISKCIAEYPSLGISLKTLEFPVNMATSETSRLQPAGECVECLSHWIINPLSTSFGCGESDSFG